MYEPLININITEFDLYFIRSNNHHNNGYKIDKNINSSNIIEILFDKLNDANIYI